MKRLRLLTVGALGSLAMVITPLGVMTAGASPPHSDQTITVSKTAAGTGAPLAGAVFTVYEWAGSCKTSSVVATATTDSSGQAVFSFEGHHNYCVVETTAPTGYTLPTANSQVVKISGCSNGKKNGESANGKVCDAALAFVDTPVPPPTPTNPPSGSSGGSGGGSPPATQASGGSAVSGATTVHTGEPWAGSMPYAVALATFGALLTGLGFLKRRRQALI